MEKKYDPHTAEREMREFWEKEDIYRFDPARGGPLFSIDTPPPTVSGSLHIGHVFSYAQAEMIARYRRMRGYNVFYPFGFDDNGLPTERLVERDAKIRAADLPRGEFIGKCLATTEKYEREFREMYKSLGFSVDWSLEYKTISPEVGKLSQARFLELARSGRAYMKESPVLFCTECRTSIAQAELDSKEAESTFNYIPFEVGGEVIAVATTRPELLYGCVALFVGPGDERYSRFVGKTAKVPLYGHEIPIMADEGADPAKGTGAVMCATYGDQTDAEWAEKYSLPYRKVITPDGFIDAGVSHVGGMRVGAARAGIIGLLSERGLLIRSEGITHAVATHERCGREVEIIPSRQWYIDILTEKGRFAAAADMINWFPGTMKKRYLAWVENLKYDWCISRQRYFGIPFPVWYCRECGRPVFADASRLPVNPLEENYPGVCPCGGTKFVPEGAVLDTWATSSLTPEINELAGVPLVPMSLRAQAHEIIRTWTFYTIVRSLYHTGRAPWSDIMISGFVLAGRGEKISKSKGNSEFSPPRLIAGHSADVLRYWAAGAKLGTDTSFSPGDLASAKRHVTKLFNAAKFALPLLEDIDLSSSIAIAPVDRWIMARTDQTIINAARLLDRYEIGAARREADELFWRDLCDNYIEIVKERLYRPDIHGDEERRSGQHALYYALFNILKIYAVYLPHLTEYIYLDFFRLHETAKSIHLLRWNEPEAPDPEILAFGEALKNSVSEMRKFKSSSGLSMRAEIPSMTLTAPARLLPLFRRTEKDLLAASCAREVVYCEQ